MSKKFSSWVNVILIITLVFPLAAFTPQDYSMPAEFFSSSDSTGIYRTRVSLPNSAALSRLDELGVRILESGGEWALILATEAQLEDLARLRFNPVDTSELGGLVAGNVSTRPWLEDEFAPLLGQASQITQLMDDGNISSGADAAGLQDTIGSLSPQQAATITLLSSVDDDADGLTNTQEVWWCTDPVDADSDGDGVSDGDEVQAAKDWLGNLASSYPPSGKPFAGWPADQPDCFDDDQDSIPDLAKGGNWD